MEWVETTGKTVEEAKDAALDQLGVDEQDAEFEVIDEGRMGLFGRVRNEARVRARVRPATPRSKDDRRDRRRGRGRGNGQGKGGGGEARGGSGEARGGRDSSGEGGRGGGSRGGTKKQSGGGRSERRSGTKSQSDGNGSEKRMDDVMVPMAEQSAVAEEFLRGLVEQFGGSADVVTETIDEDTVEVRVSGGDLGLLIGPKGSTLSAVQEVTRTVVQRKTGARNGRLLVDVSGYRAKRREALARFTREVAEKVLAEGQPISLDPMSPADRKVVHDTCNDIDGVVTSSAGEEPRRRVVISPA